MADYGLLGGIGEGLKAGVDSYLQTQRLLIEKRKEAALEDERRANKERQEKNYKLLAAKSGLVEGPEGEYTYSPEFLEREKQKQKEALAVKGLVADPNAPYGFLRPEELQPPLSPLEKYLKEAQINQIQASTAGKKTQLELDKEKFEASQKQFKETLEQRERQHRENLAAQKDLAKLKAKGSGKSGKGKIIPSTQLLAISEGIAGLTDMEQIPSVIEQEKASFGPIAGRISGLNPYSTASQLTQSFINGIRQTIGKFKEGGVLRKEDEEKYEKMLPTLSDTPEVAKGKALLILRDMQQKVNISRGVLEKSGYDVSGIPTYDVGTVSGLLQKAQAKGKEPQQPSVKLSPEDAEAINWAKGQIKKDPKDQRAIQILQMHGVK